MNYKPLAEVLKQMTTPGATVGLDQPLVGSGRLAHGWHDVTIASIATDRVVDKGYFTIVFDANANSHKQNIFLMEKDGLLMSRFFGKLIKSLFGGDQDSVFSYLKLLRANQRDALEALRGMKLTIEVKPGPGYVIQDAGAGYRAVDAITGYHIGDRQYKTVDEARQYMATLGKQRSFNKVDNTNELNTDINIEALQNISKAIIGTTPAYNNQRVN